MPTISDIPEERFLEWLRGHEPEATVGTAHRVCGCPVFRFLSSILPPEKGFHWTVTDYKVFYRKWGTSERLDEVGEDMPGWMLDVVGAVDDEWHADDAVAAGELLELLTNE